MFDHFGAQAFPSSVYLERPAVMAETPHLLMCIVLTGGRLAQRHPDMSRP